MDVHPAAGGRTDDLAVSPGQPPAAAGIGRVGPVQLGQGCRIVGRDGRRDPDQILEVVARPHRLDRRGRCHPGRCARTGSMTSATTASTPAGPSRAGIPKMTCLAPTATARRPAATAIFRPGPPVPVGRGATLFYRAGSRPAP